MEDSARRWVLLINRTRHGPYELAEIRALMAQGHVNGNTLAHLEGTGAKGFPEWKFLWQFAEFERRQRGDSPTPPGAQRRAPIDEASVATRLNERLAAELPAGEAPHSERKAIEILAVKAQAPAVDTRRFPWKAVAIAQFALLCLLEVPRVWSWVAAPGMERTPARDTAGTGPASEVHMPVARPPEPVKRDDTRKVAEEKAAADDKVAREAEAKAKGQRDYEEWKRAREEEHEEETREQE